MGRLLAAVLACGLSTDSLAHHAFAADYEDGNEGTIQGVVTEVVFRNPHARYYLEVRNDDGTTELWDLETQNLMTLGRMGWKEDTIQVGDELTVTGILGRNNKRRLSIVTVTLPGGRVISPFPSNTRSNADLNTRDATDNELPSIATKVTPGRYELDHAHAYLSFSYSHLGLSNPRLQFTDFDADLMLDGDDMGASTVNITIDPASIDSGVAALDDELRGVKFFDVSNHPEITFSNTRYEETSETTGRLAGELTVMGITKPVVLDVTINSAAMNRMTRKDMIGFSATGTIRRSDFGLAAYEQSVGDELSLDVQVEFVNAN